MDDNAVMAVLKTSRKARKQTTCYPCQRRKVKCDRGLPCRVCISRGHSFLCSYGRPAESSKITPSIKSGLEDGSHLQDSEPQLSALRKQLNHLHQELHEARKRHKKCEEAEDQVRRLQARCREYEAVHVSLRAGDWSALTRTNSRIEGDSDTSSVAPDSSECSQDARLRDDRALAPWTDLSQATDVTSSVSTVRSSTTNPVGTVRPREPEFCAVTPSEVARTSWPVGGISSMRQPQTSMGQSGDMPDSIVNCGSLVVVDRSNLSYRYKGARECVLQPPSSTPSNYEAVQHQIAGSHVLQTQTESSSTSSEKHRENSTLEFSVVPRSSPRQKNQQEQGGQVLQAPSFIERSNTMLSHTRLGRTDMPSAVSWTQISLFPPMMFSQDLDLMERSYADYCAKIVIEAPRPILPAG